MRPSAGRQNRVYSSRVLEDRQPAGPSTSGIYLQHWPLGGEHWGGYGWNSKMLAFDGDPGSESEFLWFGRYAAKITSAFQHTAFKMWQLVQDPKLDFTKS